MSNHPVFPTAALQNDTGAAPQHPVTALFEFLQWKHHGSNARKNVLEGKTGRRRAPRSDGAGGRGGAGGGGGGGGGTRLHGGAVGGSLPHQPVLRQQERVHHVICQ